MTAKSAWLDDSMVSTKSRCSSSSSVPSSSVVMPVTPLISVRTSWLVVARNSRLARAPSSAACLSARSWSWAAFCAVMSREIATTPTTSPWSSRTGTRVASAVRPPGAGSSCR